MQQPELTDEQKALQAQYEADLAAFRKDPATMEKWAAIAKKFTDAGINVHIFKWTAGNTDELLDYSFSVAKVFGAKAICTEASEDSCKLLGPAAERNGMLAAFHNHAQYAPMKVSEIEAWLNFSPANRLNFDCGHYFGAGYATPGLDPIQFIDHFAEKILSIHFKDKTRHTNEVSSNQNQVWGQGETPIREILQHVRDNYPYIHCDVELEYPVPAWSNSPKEVATCIRYMREALI
jgi:sugar phosphate isomerase/epimerase